MSYSLFSMFLFLVRVFFSLGLRFFDDGRGRTPIKYELFDESKSNMDLIYIHSNAKNVDT